MRTSHLGVIGASMHTGSSGGGVPTRSLLFNGSHFLSMSGANFDSATFDESNFAISVWLNYYSSIGTVAPLVTCTTSSPSDALYLRLVRVTDGVAIEFYGQNGATQVFDCISSTVVGTDWQHVYATFGGGVPHIYLNVDEVSYSTNSYTGVSPSEFSGTVRVANGLSGYLYQLAFFSGTVPAVGEIYDAGPKDVTGLTGLWSLLDVNGGVVTSDYVRSVDWTNNTAVAASAVIPS